jgi:hypothetical protein
MTTWHIILLGSAYLIELVAVVYFTRATALRIVGALVGAVAAGLVAMGAIGLGEAFGWWRVSLASTLYFLPLIYLSLSSLTPIYLVTWRLVRRFGWRGLAAFIGIVAVIGPPRDYLIAAKYPQWMVFAPGIAPILADAATYAVLVFVGHEVMRLIAGPAHADRLTRQPLKAA